LSCKYDLEKPFHKKKSFCRHDNCCKTGLQFIINKTGEMNIQHEQKKMSGSFFIKENGDLKAEMTYDLSDNNEMVINHTEVDEDLQGKSLGNQLVEAAVTYARKKRLKIIPVCSFAQAVFEKTDSFKDVLANT
jgi:uncharacterized protein